MGDPGTPGAGMRGVEVDSARPGIRRQRDPEVPPMPRSGEAVSPQSASRCGATPRPVIAAAPQRAAKCTASWCSIPAPSA